MVTDLPPFLYRTYRQNLHRNQHINTKGRELTRIERMFFAWPARAYVWWVHAKHKYRTNTTRNVEPPSGGFFNARKQSGGHMAVDITNHLIPYAQVKRMLERAWDEGLQAGWEECQNPDPFVNDWWDSKTPNPHRIEREA